MHPNTQTCVCWYNHKTLQGNALSYSILLHCTVHAISVITRVPRVRVWGGGGDRGCRGWRVGGVGGGERTGRAFPQENISPSTTIEPVRKPQAATLLSWVTEYFSDTLSHSSVTHTCTHSTAWQPAQPAHSRMTLYWNTARLSHQVSLILRMHRQTVFEFGFWCFNSHLGPSFVHSYLLLPWWWMLMSKLLYFSEEVTVFGHFFPVIYFADL